MVQFELACPCVLDFVAQLLRFRHHPVDCFAGSVDVVVGYLSDGRCSYNNDEKRCEDSGYPVHGELGTTTLSPSKIIRPSSLSNMR